MAPSNPRNVLVLGDQLSLDNPLLHTGQPESVRVFMVESLSESKVVWVHKARAAVFLSAMRHFAQALRDQGYTVVYSDLAQTGEHSLAERFMQLLQAHNVSLADMLEPGEWRLEQDFLATFRTHGLRLRLHADPHFICSKAEFAQWAAGYKQLRMEFFYREWRKRTGVLMDQGQPAGGQWNYDSDNRSAFPKAGPGLIPEPAWFAPDAITRQVFQEVEQRLPDHPGQLASFQWPVTRDQALQALDVFISHRLVHFGDYQDAMWTDTPFGWHALLACAINLHLLDPREVIARAEQAYRDGQAELASVEGFIRQILGWREFIRGVYWLDMPTMRTDNALNAHTPLPAWFWTGQTRMNCMRHSIGQTLEHGYAHHIQRLMVIGNFALLAGLVPQSVEDWFLAVYVDAVEWVELPNVAGMALYANGGRFTSKPYIASGAYIKRMSNYCQGCQYDPAQRAGDKACPFTTLYWGFIDQHHDSLAANPRTSLMAKNLGKLDPAELQRVRDRKVILLEQIDSL